LCLQLPKPRCAAPRVAGDGLGSRACMRLSNRQSLRCYQNRQNLRVRRTCSYREHRRPRQYRWPRRACCRQREGGPRQGQGVGDAACDDHAGCCRACCSEKCEGVSGGLLWGEKCAAVLLGRTAHGLQEPCAEVAPRAAGRRCWPRISRQYVCESRSMRAGVQRARNREVFGCGPVECMGAVYLHADRELSTRMQEECMGASMCTWTESYRHRYNLESRGKEGRQEREQKDHNQLKRVPLGHLGARG